MFEVDTEMIASALLGWLRFGKQYHFVAREAGMFSSDVLATDRKNVIEVEIKVSRSDFKADWKKDKHNHYKKRAHVHTHKYPSGHERRWQQNIPNQFFFACPAHMRDFAVEQVNEHQPEYGVIVLQDNTIEIPNFHMWKRLRMVKRAKFMHKKPPTPGLMLDLAARMSSDLAHIHFNRRMDKDWLKLATDNAKAFSEMVDIEQQQGLKK